MAITNQDTKRKVSGDGTERTFSFPFKIYRDEDITVQLIDKTTGVVTDCELTTNYSVYINPISEGGTITFTIPSTPAADEWVFMFSQLEETQNVVLPVDGAFREISVSNGLDRIVRLVQQVSERVSRAITFRIDSTQTGVDIPEPESNKLLGWNLAGDGLENKQELDEDLLAQVETARDEAVLAQTGAETAQTGAETAETGAGVAQGLAEDARDAAVTAAEKIPTPEAGDAGKILEVNAGEDGYDIVAKAIDQIAIFNDTKPANTDGGTFTEGAWRTRDLNTEVYNTIDGGSLGIVPNPIFANWTGGASVAPDGWFAAGASHAIAREGTITKVGDYSAKLTRNGTNCLLTFKPANLSYWQGKTVTFGAWVYATVASRVDLRIRDGVSADALSTSHSGGSAWEWLTVTSAISGSASEIKFGLRVFDGDTSGYIDGAVIVFGETLDEPTEYPEANQFTLPAGTYMVEASAPSFYVGGASRVKVRNITDSSDVGVGSVNWHAGGSDQFGQNSSVVTAFTITGEKVFEIQHICTTTRATDGFGIKSNLGVSEIYTQVKITKLA
jgi:hypothetical protein